MSKNKDGLAIVGVGAAACAACCAGPILGVLGAIGLTGLASTAYLGVAGLILAAIAAGLWLSLKRRRGSSGATPASAAVSVAPPTRRTPTPQR
jgi:hypothetical protein